MITTTSTTITIILKNIEADGGRYSHDRGGLEGNKISCDIFESIFVL